MEIWKSHIGKTCIIVNDDYTVNAKERDEILNRIGRIWRESDERKAGIHHDRTGSRSESM